MTCQLCKRSAVILSLMCGWDGETSFDVVTESLQYINAMFNYLAICLFFFFFLQIALKFSRPFWRAKVGEADFFGRISDTKEGRGMFGVFYDLSPKVFKTHDKTNSSSSSPVHTFSDLCVDTPSTPAASKGETTMTTTTATTTVTTHPSLTSTVANATKTGILSPTLGHVSSPLLHSISAKSAKATSEDSSSLKSVPSSEQNDVYILVTTVSGEALNEYQKLSDVEIVSKCMTCLHHMFPTEDVPAPTGHVVSRWGADPFAQMSYSYAAVGSTGEDYDHMAQDVAGQIFFAGEVCKCVGGGVKEEKDNCQYNITGLHR